MSTSDAGVNLPFSGRTPDELAIYAFKRMEAAESVGEITTAWNVMPRDVTTVSRSKLTYVAKSTVTAMKLCGLDMSADDERIEALCTGVEFIERNKPTTIPRSRADMRGRIFVSAVERVLDGRVRGVDDLQLAPQVDVEAGRPVPYLDVAASILISAERSMGHLPPRAPSVVVAPDADPYFAGYKVQITPLADQSGNAVTIRVPTGRMVSHQAIECQTGPDPLRGPLRELYKHGLVPRTATLQMMQGGRHDPVSQYDFVDPKISIARFFQGGAQATREIDELDQLFDYPSGGE